MTYLQYLYSTHHQSLNYINVTLHVNGHITLPPAVRSDHCIIRELPLLESHLEGLLEKYSWSYLRYQLC